MPTDAAGIPFWYASKPGGFFYEVEDNPENSPFADWPAEVNFNGDGTFTMQPNGPTDFGLGKYAGSFSDSIGGCNMSFTDTKARGYAYKADDARDIEYKFIATFTGIQSGNDLSISARTGHHTGSGCCQGFAYMFGTDPNTNPTQFRFRKEMWHVSYHESPEGSFTHPRANFKINGHGKVGIGFVIYNKPGTTDRVVLEGWFNPNPVANIADWVMVKRIEDFPGNGWGDDGGDCDGDSDQVGTWSGPQNRTKTNSTSGSVKFEAVSIREIDPTRTLDDTGIPPPDPGGGGGTVPPPSGGGGTTPSSITPVITYQAQMGTSEDIPGEPLNITALGRMISRIAGNIATQMVNPCATGTFGTPAWARNGTTATSLVNAPCDFFFKDTRRSYPDGLNIVTYWSNSDNACISPGATTVNGLPGTTGTDANDLINHGGRIMKNPHICLIFWGAQWNTRTSTPTRNQIITEIRDKLLGTDRQYFSGIQQYGAPGTPVWGTTGLVTAGGTTTTPNASNIVGDVPTIPDSFTAPLTYCAVTCVAASATAASVTNLQWTTMLLSEELIEAQTDPAGTGWYGDTLEDPLEEPIREIGDNPCDLDTGSFKGIYASGLAVMAYWSNSHNNCIIPGITATDIGDSTAITYHGGQVIKNPVLRLIFWGTEWTAQTSPTKAEVIAEVQTKLLVTNATFFSQLSQYSSCGTPTYGSAVQNTNIAYPTAGDHGSDRAAIEAVIKDSLDTALLPVTNSATMSKEIYIVFLAKNKTITSDEGYNLEGYHKTLEATFPT